MKKCIVCKKDFIFNSGAQKYCSKECYKMATKQLARNYKKTHRKEINKCKREYYKKHKIRISIAAKEYQETHKKQISEQRKKYYLNNKENIISRVKKYRQENKDKINRHKKNKFQKNTNFRLSCILRIRIIMALKRNSKKGHTTDLLGCSIEQVKEHLENHFKSGMTWKNIGKWHLDHIRPCASFDLSKKSEQRKCFHYTNLQPLWAEENWKKGCKY